MEELTTLADGHMGTINPFENVTDDGLRDKRLLLDDDADYIERTIANNMGKYWPPLILIFGTVFNILSFLVYSRKSMRGSVTGLFFRVLAVADILAIYMSHWQGWLKRLGVENFWAYSDLECKFYFIFYYVIVDFPSWILVLVTLERCIGVTIPHRAKILCTKKVAAILLVAMVIILTACHFPLPLIGRSYRIVEPDGSVIPVICYLHVESDTDPMWNFVLHIWPTLDILMFCGLPFIIITLLNICIITKLIAAARRRKAMSTDNSGDSRMTQVTVTLLTVSFTYIILNFPLGLYSIYIMTWGGENLKSAESLAMDYLWIVTGIMLSTTNNAINFLLYCVTGPKFRAELFKLLRCGRKNGAGTSTATTSTIVPTKSQSMTTDNKV